MRLRLTQLDSTYEKIQSSHGSLEEQIQTYQQLLQGQSVGHLRTELHWFSLGRNGLQFHIDRVINRITQSAVTGEDRERKEISRFHVPSREFLFEDHSKKTFTKEETER